MQEYRSGHNEAVLKTVWVKAHGGSNPSSCATQKGYAKRHIPFVLYLGLKRDSRVGAVLREQNALPCGAMVKCCLKAKDDVDNVEAGRAAKGANPSSCANESTQQGAFFVGAGRGLEGNPN